jgi:hypothetical protein
MPLKFNGITEAYMSTESPYYSKSNPHKGVDLGWNEYQGEPVYAINDGVVMFVDKTTGSNNAGNYIWIKHEFTDYALWSRYCHLKDNSTLVKVGQKVTRGQQIASMGGTYGYATHLHYEMWKTPKNWKFNWNDRMKYLVNPLNFTFAFEDQSIGTGELSKVITRVLGTSKQAKRDTSKNQIEVVGEYLRIRKGAGTNQTILGYIDYGIYDYTETKNANNYTWYNLGFGWIAGTKEDTKIYPKEEQTDDKDKKIAELEEQVKKLDTELLAQKTFVEKQKEEIEQLNEKLSNYANLKEHKVDKTEYITLINGDRIYF